MKVANVEWDKDMHFTAHLGSGHTVAMDAVPKVGGHDAAPRPTELLLAALGGCTGMDVVSILAKMRVPPEHFAIHIEAESATEYPKVFTDFLVVYRVTGANLPADKVLRAVELSWTTYCSIANLLKKGARLSYRVELNGQEITPAAAETR